MRATPLAEQATLGALLLEPAGLAGLGGWLRPNDFSDPWHAEVYRTIKCLAAAGEPVGAAEVGRDLLARLGPTRADLARVIGLLRAAPPRPDVPTYAVMVLEDSLRRETAAQGVLLRAGALSAVLDGTPRPAQTVAAVVDDTLHSAAERWATATGHSREPRRRISGVPRALGTPNAGTEQALAADRLLRAHPDPMPSEVADHEAALIAALLARPEHLRLVIGWLRPAAMTNRSWRPLYESMVRLHDYRRPIDTVTVLWETQRTSRAGGRGPDPALVHSRADTAVTANPAHLAHQVAGDHLRLTAEAAARSLQSAATNPGLEIADVLGTGHLVTAALRSSAAPLHRADPDAHAAGPANVRQLPTAGSHQIGPVAG
jgi:hypothetical protein